MASERYSLEKDEPLPPIDGPKLGPFKHREKPIQVLELLSPAPNSPDYQAPQASSDDSGGHGHVFKVRIGEDEYALKVFKFFNGPRAMETTFWWYRNKVDPRTLTYHSDPFFAECRAYGKIEEIQEERQKQQDQNQKRKQMQSQKQVRKQNQEQQRKQTRKHKQDLKRKPVADIAAPCYGFISLPAVPYEDMFRTRFGIVNWGRTPHDMKRRPKKRIPFRALVKKVITSREPIQNPEKMARDLAILYKKGIIPRDICPRNYVGGLLVDFGAAWTKPHWSLRVLSEGRIEDTKEEGLASFDVMLSRAGHALKYRLSKSKLTYLKLRRLLNQPSRTNIQGSILQFESPSSESVPRSSEPE